MEILSSIERIFRNPAYAYHHNNLSNLLDKIIKQYTLEEDDMQEIQRLRKALKSCYYYNHFTDKEDWSKKEEFFRIARTAFQIISQYQWND